MTMGADLVATTSELERTAFRLVLLVLHLGWAKLPAAVRRSPAGEEADRAILCASDFFNREYDPAGVEEEKARLAGGLYRLANAGDDPFDLLMLFIHSKRWRRSRLIDRTAPAPHLEVKARPQETKPATVATRSFGPAAMRSLRALLRVAAEVLEDGLHELEPPRRRLPAVREADQVFHELTKLVRNCDVDELEDSLERVDRVAAELAVRDIQFSDLLSLLFRSRPRLRLVRDDEPA
jgi:hypothetical protein